VPQAHYRVVTAGYFGTAGIPFIKGREFTEDDRATTAPVAIISRRFADEFWSDASAIGEHLRLGNTTTPVEIVGIAADVKQFTLDAAPTSDLYVPLRQAPGSEAPLIASRMYWLVATSGDPAPLVDGVRTAVHALDNEIATSGAQPLSRVLNDALGARRFNAATLTIFGQLALLLAAAGVYAVTAHAVQQRRREIGVRMALGARPWGVVAAVLSSECRAIAGGAMAGTVAAIGASRLLAATLFQVGGVDSMTLAAALVVMIAAAAAGCYIPARRAAAVDPVEALR
jgi:hypothetical protein